MKTLHEVPFQQPPNAGFDFGLPTVEIVVPVYNEERALPGCLHTLHPRLVSEFPFPWRITIADNGSTDRTWRTARDLADRLPGVNVIRVGGKGKGLALRTGWAASDADIVAYTDVDLSTGLDGLLPLIAPLASGHSDLAIGSRLAPGSRTIRGPWRELVSRCYIGLVRLTHGARFTDAQCGFKAARAQALRPLLTVARDDGWFFDTELLLLAEHNGLRIHEIPVDWVEDVDSKVHVLETALHDLLGLWRMARLRSSGRATVAVPRRTAPAAEHPAVEPARRPSWQVGLLALAGLLSTVAHALGCFSALAVALLLCHVLPGASALVAIGVLVSVVRSVLLLSFRSRTPTP